MVSKKFYDAYKQACMMTTGVSHEEWQTQIQDTRYDNNFEVLEEMEEYFNKNNTLATHIKSPNINGETKECIIIMEKILLGRL